MSRRVTVVGGGPGGVFAARLLKLAEPSLEVCLHDEHPPLDTFGFGVGLSPSTQKSLGASDPETFELIDRASHRGQGMRLYNGGRSVHVPDSDRTAIARAELLQILYRQAEAAGVRIEVGARADAWNTDADVVIAADGVGSATRTARADDFGATVEEGRQRFLWLGADVALPDALFAPASTPHGIFTTHAYPYRSDRSTFLVETDTATWRAAGFEGSSEGLAAGESDERARAYLEEVFADHLGGAQLLGNHSRWTQFRTVRCRRWSVDNVVLVGDAAHTAHYSIGSGTKLAMEDAIVLSTALSRHESSADAFREYREARQPSVCRLQQLAERSAYWWESYVRRLDVPPELLLASFLTRAGNVSLEAFVGSEPELATAALEQYAGVAPPPTGIEKWVIDRPLAVKGLSLPTRDARQAGVALAPLAADVVDPHSDLADELIDACRDLVAGSTAGQFDGVELVGGAGRAEVLQRLDVAERIRAELGVLTSVRAPAEHTADLAAGLVCGRTDLVSIDQESAG